MQNNKTPLSFIEDAIEDNKKLLLINLIRMLKSMLIR